MMPSTHVTPVREEPTEQHSDAIAMPLVRPFGVTIGGHGGGGGSTGQFVLPRHVHERL